MTGAAAFFISAAVPGNVDRVGNPDAFGCRMVAEHFEIHARRKRNSGRACQPKKHFARP
jgi:hypothetical protein